MNNQFEQLQSLCKSLFTVQICEQTIDLIDDPTSQQVKDIHQFTSLIKSHSENIEQICIDNNLDRESVIDFHTRNFDGPCTFEEAIENSVVGDEPDLIEQEVVDQALKSMGYSDELIKGRGLNIANLRKVRRQVVTADGRVYMKTMYVKKEEIQNEKSVKFLKQHEFELSAQVGDRVNTTFTGESTGAVYNTDKLKVRTINDDHFVLEFTEPFETNNRNNYTYPVGATVIIPKTTNTNWNKNKSISRFEVPVVTPIPTATTPTRSTSGETVTSIDQISVGDDVLIKVGDDENVPAQIRYIHPQGRFITIRANGTDYRRTLGNFKKPGTTSTFTLDTTTVDQLTAAGVRVTLPSGGVTRVEDGTESYQTHIYVDRFGNENPRGRTRREVTRTRPRYREATPAERSNGNAMIYSNFNQTYPNFNMMELATEMRAAITSGISEQAGREASIKFNIGSNGRDMSLEVSAPGLSMTRRFSKEGDQTQVYHAYFTLNAQRQGTDIGKSLFKSLYKQYKNAGIGKIKVSANIDVGGYAWARYGFTSTRSQAESMLNALVPRTHRGFEINAQHIGEMKRRFNEFYRVNPASKRFPMNLVATVGPANAAGKAALLNKHWSGEIDLKDSTQRTHFENYIGAL